MNHKKKKNQQTSKKSSWEVGNGRKSPILSSRHEKNSEEVACRNKKLQNLQLKNQIHVVVPLNSSSDTFMQITEIKLRLQSSISLELKKQIWRERRYQYLSISRGTASSLNGESIKNAPLRHKKVTTHTRNQSRHIHLIMYEQCALNKPHKLTAQKELKRWQTLFIEWL